MKTNALGLEQLLAIGNEKTRQGLGETLLFHTSAMLPAVCGGNAGPRIEGDAKREVSLT